MSVEVPEAMPAMANNIGNEALDKETYNHVSPKKDKGAEEAFEAKIKELDRQNNTLKGANDVFDGREDNEIILGLQATLKERNSQITTLQSKSNGYQQLLQQISDGYYIKKEEIANHTQREEEEEEDEQMNNEYVSKYKEAECRNENMLRQFRDFQSAVVEQLTSLRGDTKEFEEGHAVLQGRFNDERQQRSRMNKSADMKSRKLNNEMKALRNKYNEAKNENSKNSQNAEKIDKAFQSEKSQMANKVEKLGKDKAHLNKQLLAQRELVERVRKEKKEVTEKNQDYLRVEKQKISKELDRERSSKLGLEEEVNRLTDEVKNKTTTLNQIKSNFKDKSKQLSSQSSTAESALKEKNHALQKLQEKSKLSKSQSQQIDEQNNEIGQLNDKLSNFRKENGVLHESLRKKSEKEKKFEDRQKTVGAKEKKLNDKEKWISKKLDEIKQKTRSSNRQKRSQTHSQHQASKEQESKDPLVAIRNMLPWHWISIVLFVVLMLAVASRNL